MNLAGKSREQIDAALRDKSHAELIEIIYSLATSESMIAPGELAARRQISKRAVMRLIKAGKLRAHQTLRNSVRIPLDSVREWDRNTALY